MKKFYFIKSSGANAETGPNYPQVKKVYPVLDYGSKESLYRLFDSFYEIPKNEPKIDYVTLNKGAKPTDVLSSAMFVLLGLLISQKLRAIFESSSLPENKFYEVPVKIKNTVIKYFWLHMIYKFKGKSFDELVFTNVMINKSKFIIESHLSKVSDLEINSTQELMDSNRRLPLGHITKASSLTLDEKFLTNLPDIFKINLLSTDWIINEKLKNRIVEGGITGVDISEVKNVFFN